MSTPNEKSPGTELVNEIEDLADRIDNYLDDQQKAEDDPRLFDNIRSDREKIKTNLDSLVENLIFWL